MHCSLLLQQPACLSLFLLLLLHTSLAEPINVTIDDQDGDPTNGLHIFYSPSAAWQAGQTCTSCTAKVSPATGAYLGTWSDTTFYPAGDAVGAFSGQIMQASVPFVGTAVYVVCILTGASTSPDGNTDLTFKIDNTTTSTFQKAPDGNATYLFNQTVFAQTGLPNGLHTITIEAGLADQKALVLLDAIIYTADDNSTTSSSDTSSPSATGSGSSDTSQSGSPTIVGMIVGPVVAAVIVVLVAPIAFFLFICKRRRSQREHDYISAFGGTVVGEAIWPRSHDPDTHDMQHVVNTGALNERIVNPTSIYPVTASGSKRGTDVRKYGLDASRKPLPLGGGTDLAKNVAPSQVDDSTVFSDGVSPPAYDAIFSSSAAPQSVSPPNLSNYLRPLPHPPEFKL